MKTELVRLPFPLRAARAAGVACALLGVADPAISATGDLDTTFGIGGRVSLIPGNADVQGTSVIQQADGRIVVAGWRRDPSQGTTLMLVRLEADGTLDAGFGSGGMLNVAPSEQAAAVVMQQDDGKLVVAGRHADARTVLWRFLANGTPDDGFGTDGAAILAGAGQVAGLVQQADGKLVVAGTNRGSMVLVRARADGSPDTSFGGDGRVSVTLRGSAPSAHALIRQPDGKLVVAGDHTSLTPGCRGGTVAVVRTTADGTLDESFGSGGIAEISLDFRAFDDCFIRTWNHSVVLRDDGRIVINGMVGAVGFFVGFLLQLEADGTPDSTFGAGGIVFHGDTVAAAGQFDGKIITAGNTYAGEAFAGDEQVSAMDLVLEGFNPDGGIDTAFGVQGTSVADFLSVHPINSAGAMTRQGDGNLVLVGTSRPPWPSTDPPALIIARFSAGETRFAGLIGPTSTAGEVPDNQGPVVFTVRRTGGSTGPVSVSFDTVDGSATGGSDYVPQSGRLEWADGDVSTREISVQLLDDSGDGIEQFDVRLSDATGGALLTTSTTVVSITDSARPVILLLGDNPQIITTGESYVEPGATAEDDVDGDISGSIVIDSSTVDTSSAGTYVVTYDVTDSSGNGAHTALRDVIVSEPPPPELPPSGPGAPPGPSTNGGGAVLWELLLAAGILSWMHARGSVRKGCKV